MPRTSSLYGSSWDWDEFIALWAGCAHRRPACSNVLCSIYLTPYFNAALIPSCPSLCRVRRVCMVRLGIGTNSSHVGQGVHISASLFLMFLHSCNVTLWTRPPAAAYCAAYVEFACFVAPHLLARGDLLALNAGALTWIYFKLIKPCD